VAPLRPGERAEKRAAKSAEKAADRPRSSPRDEQPVKEKWGPEDVPAASLPTTATTANRLADKARIERELGLPEVGDADTVFLDRKLNVLARGYERIVYGDHGPYLELTASQIHWPSFPKYRKKHALAYYDEYFTEDMAIMICAQRRPVWDRPNPPRYGKHSVNNNRPEGYADYRPDRYYMGPDPAFVIVHRPAHLPRPSEQLSLPASINAADGPLHAAWQKRFATLQSDRVAVCAERDAAQEKVEQLTATVAALEAKVTRLLDENSTLRDLRGADNEGGTGMGVELVPRTAPVIPAKNPWTPPSPTVKVQGSPF